MKPRHIVQALMIVGSVLSGCGAQSAAPPPSPLPKAKLAVIVPQGSENDKGYNEFTLKGARDSAQAAGLEFASVTSQAVADDERNIEQLVADGADVIVLLSFLAGDTVSQAARRHRGVIFVTDTIYAPGFGCDQAVADCYAGETGLTNVVSLAFAEDEVGYLAGVLGACMSESAHVASVGGIEVPAVVRFVTGFQRGAVSAKPAIKVSNQYIPSFNDPAAGKVAAQAFIADGADVIFPAAGNTGNGALLAAKEAGAMGIGVDVDQYLTYPEVKEILLSSAKKNVDVAVSGVVADFAAGTLRGGVRVGTIANGGVSLAPYHDWEGKIPEQCKDQVLAAEAAVKADPTITGGK